MENKLTVEQKRIASDMLNSYDECGEWLGIAFERMGRRGNILIAYIDPEGPLTDALYDKSNFRFSDKVEFSVSTIDETNTSWIRLEDDIFEFLYTRHFDELPEEMRAQIETVFYLPIGEVWPIGRYNYSIEVGFGRGGNLGYNAASRGIREIK